MALPEQVKQLGSQSTQVKVPNGVKVGVPTFEQLAKQDPLCKYWELRQEVQLVESEQVKQFAAQATQFVPLFINI